MRLFFFAPHRHPGAPAPHHQDGAPGAATPKGYFKWQSSKAETLGIHGAMERDLTKKSNLLTEMTKCLFQVLP